MAKRRARIARGEPANHVMKAEDARALIDRNPKVRELMKLWNPDLLQKGGRILLRYYVSDEKDADVDWLPVYLAGRESLGAGQPQP